MAEESKIRKGVSWASLLAVLMGVGIIAYLTWQSTKKTDTTNYAKGADHTENVSTLAPVENNYPLSFRCGRLFSIDPDWAKKDKDVAHVKRDN